MIDITSQRGIIELNAGMWDVLLVCKDMRVLVNGGQ